MLALRHRDDPLPPLSPLPTLRCRREHDPAELAQLMAKAPDIIEPRLAAGHRAYVAFLDGTPAAFGWVATHEAAIGEIRATLRLPSGHRYLWNFVTLPAFRGRGIYPRLLRAILEGESPDMEWAWIMFAPEYHASGAGIDKAGFTRVAEIAFDAHERVAFRVLREGAGAMIERLLAIPRATGALTPCWMCVRAGRGAMSCADGQCHCDYQRPETGCAAA